MTDVKIQNSSLVQSNNNSLPSGKITEMIPMTVNPLEIVSTSKALESGKTCVSYLRAKITGSDKRAPNKAEAVFIEKARAGKAASLLSMIPECEEMKVDDMGKCIFNSPVEGLKECSCLPCCRKRNSKLRADYETAVINKVVELSRDRSNLSITVMASGFLFGESLLLINLLGQLKEMGWKGRLNINFIDTKYTPVTKEAETYLLEARKAEDDLTHANMAFIMMITVLSLLGLIAAINIKKIISNKIALAVGTVGGAAATAGLYHLWNKVKEAEAHIEDLRTKYGSRGFSINSAKGKIKRKITQVQVWDPKWNDHRASKSIPDFISLTQTIISDGIEVKSRFFKNTEDLVKLAQDGGDKFKGNLIIGSDIEDTVKEVALIKSKASQAGCDSILLVKGADNKPRLIVRY